MPQLNRRRARIQDDEDDDDSNDEKDSDGQATARPSSRQAQRQRKQSVPQSLHHQGRRSNLQAPAGSPPPSSPSSRSASPSTPNNPELDTSETQDDLIALQTKNLVRLALSSEFSRQPIRRTDINARCGTRPSTFKAVFEAAQLALRQTFGVEMVELPSREKTTLRERLASQAAASSFVTANANASAASGVGGGGAAATGTSASAGGLKTWIVQSTLTHDYRAALSKTNSALPHPPSSRSAAGSAEASYTGLYSFIVTVITLSGGSITDEKLTRHLRKVNAESSTPVDSTQKLLERMRREGYIDRKVDNVAGEQVIEYIVGPRGKVEIGDAGVAGLVKGVYARAVEEGAEQEAEVNRRIERSLKIAGNDFGGGGPTSAAELEDERGPGVRAPAGVAATQTGGGGRRGRPPKRRREDLQDESDGDDG